MSDLKSVTVQYLRELARKWLGRGQGRLAVSQQVLEQLKRHLPWLAALVETPPPPEAHTAGPQEPDSSEPPRAPKPAPRPLPGNDEEKTPVYIPPRPAKVVNFPPKPKPNRPDPDDEPTIVPGLPPHQHSEAPAAPPSETPVAQPVPPAPSAAPPLLTAAESPTVVEPPPLAAIGSPVVAESPTVVEPPPLATTQAPAGAPAIVESPAPVVLQTFEPPVAAAPPDPVTPPVPPEPPPPAEPMVEGFFVARIAGEGEAQRHHLTGPMGASSHAPLAVTDPDGLPRAYADDTVLLMARDPYTLFALWDFSEASLRQALEGLEAPHAVLRVYEDSALLRRVIDITLESRGYYIHGMVCGRPYRVEVHLVGRQGRSRRIGRSSNLVFLPAVGPAPDTSVRMMRMPPLAPRRNGGTGLPAIEHPRTEPVEGREYITWRRVALPSSGEAVPPAESPREPGGPGAPGAPGGMPPPPGYLYVRRAEGSSEHGAPRLEVPPVPPGLQPPRPEGPARSWVDSRGPAGASEQWVWSRGPAGSSSSWEEWRGPTAISAPWVMTHGPASSSDHWAWSRGPAGSSEPRGPGSPPPGRTAEQWVWVHGPTDAPGPWWHSHGPAGSSEAWLGSRGPSGSSELSGRGR